MEERAQKPKNERGSFPILCLVLGIGFLIAAPVYYHLEFNKDPYASINTNGSIFREDSLLGRMYQSDTEHKLAVITHHNEYVTRTSQFLALIGIGMILVMFILTKRTET